MRDRRYNERVTIVDFAGYESDEARADRAYAAIAACIEQVIPSLRPGSYDREQLELTLHLLRRRTPREQRPVRVAASRQRDRQARGG